MNDKAVIIRQLGHQDYLTCWQAMKEFTNSRNEQTLDEIWSVEHPSVFTQGQNGKNEHFIKPTTIPIIKVDRGGQVTYHGPGQLVTYTLIDIKRKKINIRNLVTCLEKSVIALLGEFNISAYAKKEAPGIYVNEAKICSIGLRIRRGCSYHGLAFNINMDLGPFTHINPCGFTKLTMTQLSQLGGPTNLREVSDKLMQFLASNLGYTNLISG